MSYEYRLQLPLRLFVICLQLLSTYRCGQNECGVINCLTNHIVCHGMLWRFNVDQPTNRTAVVCFVAMVLQTCYSCSSSGWLMLDLDKPVPERVLVLDMPELASDIHLVRLPKPLLVVHCCHPMAWPRGRYFR